MQSERARSDVARSDGRRRTLSLELFSLRTLSLSLSLSLSCSQARSSARENTARENLESATSFLKEKRSASSEKEIEFVGRTSSSRAKRAQEELPFVFLHFFRLTPPKIYNASLFLPFAPAPAAPRGAPGERALCEHIRLELELFLL